MKILHIAPSSVYTEGWGYQDNLLPKYQAKLGHSVTVIVPTIKHSENGGTEPTSEEDYLSKDGYRVIRKKREKYFFSKITDVLSILSIYPLLKNLRPDFVFYHGLVSATIFQVTKYKKKINGQCIIVQDNHLDYNIGFIPKNVKWKLLQFIYRSIYSANNKYITRVYGVTPWRKKYAEEIIGVPKEKTDVLIMGADDELIDFKHKSEIRKAIREQYGISNDDFLIVTGGKIDEKKKIHYLMNAVKQTNAKLLIFGSVEESFKETFEQAKNKNVICIGWISSKKVYDYFFAADLCFFPGQHSVLWEQACASKVPCVFAYWEDMQHVDNGGNSDFVTPITVEKVTEKIEELLFTEKYFHMKEIAESDKTDIYLYSEIARKSLECISNS